ncbi:beta-phosphoglucomutase [Lactobacillus kalixensis]|uniref:Beta-phosphoglucomutase n=1 Tax=Lactobacillus kalixensis DSM 16043 TaxID=1423763 RepID=A0A0R1UC96_9LACO|nr:beta-phosphoglucomutase [Lactobacillus kalixensis]KRL88584.1 beta-phosphoglucomutase [Lactobacillus kalixensis DSM 16043]
MLKGLLFDLDGVLTNSAKYHLSAWNNLANELGITLTDAQLDQLRGISRMDSLNMILKFGGQEDKYTEAEKEKFAAEKNAKFVEQIQKMTPEDILPGIPQLLKDAKAQNLKMAIASASKNAPTILNKLGIMDEFDGIVDPSTLHRGKPDPEIYVKAQELLDLKADEVISFEDAQAGVEAIKAADQFAVGIGDKELLKEADYIVASTAELKLSEIEEVFNKRK